MKSFLLSVVTTVSDATTISNPMLDENGQFVPPEEAVRNFSTIWKELDLVNKLIDKLPTIILAVLTLIIGFWLSRLLSKLVVKALKSRGVDSSVYMFIKNIISVIIKIAFVLMALSMFVNVNSFLAAFGAAGLTAGIGLQNSVAQFASGIQILLNHPFKAGDFIEVDGQSGFVSEIRFMNTIINTVDNKRIVIPNSHFTTNNIINFSAEGNRRVDLSYQIGYAEDIQLAKSVCLQTAKECPDVLEDPPIEVHVGSHGESSIELIVRLWCPGDKYWDVYFTMQENVKLAFDENNISIPYNQLDVHMR